MFCALPHPNVGFGRVEQAIHCSLRDADVFEVGYEVGEEAVVCEPHRVEVEYPVSHPTPGERPTVDGRLEVVANRICLQRLLLPTLGRIGVPAAAPIGTEAWPGLAIETIHVGA